MLFFKVNSDFFVVSKLGVKVATVTPAEQPLVTFLVALSDVDKKNVNKIVNNQKDVIYKIVHDMDCDKYLLSFLYLNGKKESIALFYDCKLFIVKGFEKDEISIRDYLKKISIKDIYKNISI